VTRRKAFRPSRVSFRKGRSAGRSRSRGSNPEMLAPQGVGTRTSCDAGTIGSGSVVPATTTRDVRRRRRARQRLLQPTRRGRSVTRGAARRRPSAANAKVLRSMRELAPQSSESCASRPKLARAKARPSLPTSSNRANGSGRAGALTPYRRMRDSRRVHTTGAGHGSALSILTGRRRATTRPTRTRIKNR